MTTAEKIQKIHELKIAVEYYNQQIQKSNSRIAQLTTEVSEGITTDDIARIVAEAEQE